MSKKEKLPSVLYAKVEKDRNDIEYCVAGKDFSALVDMGETAKIGVYNLAEIIEVEGTAVIVR